MPLTDSNWSRLKTGSGGSRNHFPHNSSIEDSQEKEKNCPNQDLVCTELYTSGTSDATVGIIYPDYRIQLSWVQNLDLGTSQFRLL